MFTSHFNHQSKCVSRLGISPFSTPEKFSIQLDTNRCWNKFINIMFQTHRHPKKLWHLMLSGTGDVHFFVQSLYPGGLPLRQPFKHFPPKAAKKRLKTIHQGKEAHNFNMISIYIHIYMIVNIIIRRKNVDFIYTTEVWHGWKMVLGRDYFPIGKGWATDLTNKGQNGGWIESSPNLQGETIPHFWSSRKNPLKSSYENPTKKRWISSPGS